MRWVLLSLLFVLFSNQIKAEDRNYYRIFEAFQNARNEEEWNRAMIQYQAWVREEYQRRNFQTPSNKQPEPVKNKPATPPPKLQAPATTQKLNPIQQKTTPDTIPEWFKQIDFDKDGQIGLHEWIRARGKISDFDILDRNRDGLFTREELKRALKLGLVK